MSGPANLYQLLGVEPDAMPDAIRAASRRLAWQHHPDDLGVARSRAVRRRRVAEIALLAVASLMAWVALAGPAVLVTR